MPPCAKRDRRSRGARCAGPRSAQGQAPVALAVDAASAAEAMAELAALQAHMAKVTASVSVSVDMDVDRTHGKRQCPEAQGPGQLQSGDEAQSSPVAPAVAGVAPVAASLSSLAQEGSGPDSQHSAAGSTG